MKKIMFIVCLLILSGCGNDYFKELGYSKDQANIIRSLSEEDQVFFSDNYGPFSISLLDNENFNKEHIKTYILFNEMVDGGLVCDLVNDGKLSEEDIDIVKTLVSDKDYKQENLEKYLEKKNENLEYVVDYVNSGSDKYFGIVNRLSGDPYFISDNLKEYLEHESEKENIRDLIEYVNTKNYLEYYSELNEAKVDKYGVYTLVNKFYVLEKDYEPDDLVAVDSTYGVGRLQSEAYEAFIKMFDDAKKENLSFYITSPYRSYETQENLYNSYLAVDSKENVDIYSARPGSSEHQLGLAVDILKNGYDFGNFEETKEAKWLDENSYKYGFILRYPEDKTEITGYKYEPWHFRYVGDIAEDVYNSGISYDEYFEKFIKNTVNN